MQQLKSANTPGEAEMQLDLRNASKVLRKHIADRVRDYPLYVNNGPGRDEAPVKQITVGYQFDQAGWLAIVFDTRPNAGIDGEWNSFIEPNAIDFAEWQKAYSDLVENGSPIALTLPNGTKRRLGEDTTVEQLAEYIGTTIRDVLICARDSGAFAGMPIAPDCTYVVEEHDGYYGWSDQAETGPQSEQSYLAQLEGDVSTKTKDRQVEHWVNVLERIASGKENESEWSFLAPDHAIERLKGLGERAVVPVLKFVRKWASKPEFDGDRPKRKINELPMQTPTIRALMLVRDSSCHSPDAEVLLCDILRRSIKANADRKLWGIMPVWAARCLSKLADKYPQPIQHASTNELVNRENYTGKRRTKR